MNLFRRLSLPLLLCGLFSCAVGAKWSLIERYGSDVPYMDQWDGEGANALEPWFDKSAGLRYIFWWPHNEHRIGWTRLWSIGLAVINGQWDPKMTMTVNATVHAGVLVLLVWFLRDAMQGPARLLIPGIALALAAVPVAWQNTLESFQIQLYLLLLCAVVVLGNVAGKSPRRASWWLAIAFGIAGLGTMASSFCAPLATLVVVVVHAWQERRWTTAHSYNAIACVALSVLGMLAVNSVPGHAFLRAQTFGDFAIAVRQLLAWPWNDFWPVFLLVHAPIGFWAWHTSRRRLWTHECAHLFVLGLVVWALIQIGLAAYGRNRDQIFLSSRYMDLVGVLLIADAAAIGLLWQSVGARARIVTLAAGVAWSAGVFLGLQHYGRQQMITHVLPLQPLYATYAKNLRTFLESGDVARFRAAQPVAELPYPVHDPLLTRLQSPALRRLFPAGIRPALQLVPSPATHGFALETAQPSPGAPIAIPIWSNSGGLPTRFESEALPKNLLPYLQVQFAGDPKLPSDALRLETDDGRKFPPDIRRLDGERWQTACWVVPADAKSVRLVAETPSNAGSIEFSAPVEIGRLTRIAGQAREQAGVLSVVGAIAILAGTVLPLLQRASRPSATTSTG